jgi:hypothetical protein
MLKSILSSLRINLTSSGNQYEQYARQNNCNLVESNGDWLLYKDGKLVARDKHPWDALQTLVHNS